MKKRREKGKEGGKGEKRGGGKRASARGENGERDEMKKENGLRGTALETNCYRKK